MTHGKPLLRAPAPGRVPAFLAALLVAVVLGGCFCVEQSVIHPTQALRPLGLSNGVYVHFSPGGEPLDERLLVWDENLNAMAFLDVDAKAMDKERMAWFVHLREPGYYMVQTTPNRSEACSHLIFLASVGAGSLTLYDYDRSRQDELLALVREYGMDSLSLESLTGDLSRIREFFTALAQSGLAVPMDTYVKDRGKP